MLRRPMAAITTRARCSIFFRGMMMMMMILKIMYMIDEDDDDYMLTVAQLTMKVMSIMKIMIIVFLLSKVSLPPLLSK